MNKSKITVSFLIIFLIFSFGIYGNYISLNNKEEASEPINNLVTQPNSTGNTSPFPDKNNYYIIYVKQENGVASSFVPLNLNPGFKNDSDYHVSISIDDNGNIINRDKVIEIDNFIVSKSNKKIIKKIAGKEKYNEALKEIENRLAEIQKSL
ncbi:hypothetical protein AB1282_23585 [Gottfriedia sp. S16(2024)]|uniref:hypothetical protein n=1 Tax=Gottfriedia sp. S16(2024) TaxID=3162883 RepID=UPI003D20C5F1